MAHGGLTSAEHKANNPAWTTAIASPIARRYRLEIDPLPGDTVFLADLPGDTVWLVCDKCGRKGRYRIAGLIKKHGADARLTYLRLTIAQCPKARAH